MAGINNNLNAGALQLTKTTTVNTEKPVSNGNKPVKAAHYKSWFAAHQAFEKGILKVGDTYTDPAGRIWVVAIAEIYGWGALPQDKIK